MSEKKVSEKKRISNDKWDKDNLKRMSLAMPIHEYENMKDNLVRTEENANEFIRRAIRLTIENDKITGYKKKKKVSNEPVPAGE